MQYDRIGVEYYKYYLDDVREQSIAQVKSTSTKEDVYRTSCDAYDEIRLVADHFHHSAGFSIYDDDVIFEEYMDDDLHVAITPHSIYPPLSSLSPYIVLRLTLSGGVSAEVHFDNGVTFLTPLAEESYDINTYPSDKNAPSSPFTVSAGDSEKTYLLFCDTTDPVVFPSLLPVRYNKDHDFGLSIIFEKDGYVVGYRAYNLFDKTTYKFLTEVKSIVYGKDFRHQVTEEKALDYIEQARQGKDGELADGIQYSNLGRTYIADRKNLQLYRDYRMYAKSSDTRRYFEIVGENSPNKLSFALPADGTFTLTAKEGEFTLNGTTAKTVSVTAGDRVVYKNASGKLDFISGVMQPVYIADASDDESKYQSFFFTFAMSPDGTQPHAQGSLIYEPLAARFITCTKHFLNVKEDAEITTLFNAVTRSAIAYHEDQFLSSK